MNTPRNEQTRTYEKTIQIDAAIEDVWKLLTDASEITRWFSTEAEVEPGEGGSIYMAWNEDFKGKSTIEIWDPPNHLRQLDRREAWQASSEDAPGGTNVPTALPLTVDYYLSSEKGKTVLRLVHSGFGMGSEWDEEFDSIKRGWGTMLLNLSNYAEKHIGKPAFHYWRQYQLSISAEEAWKSINEAMNPEAVPLAEGVSIRNPVSDGDLEMDILVDGYEYGLTTGSDRQQLIRFSLYPTPEGCLAWFDHLAYGFGDGEIEKLNKKWLELLKPVYKG